MRYPYKIKRVYVVVYGDIWALTPKRAADLLFDGATDRGWNLYDYGRELKRFPSRYLHRDEDGYPQQSYNEYPLLEPLDWPAFEYAGMFEYLFPDDPRVDDLPVFDDD
jgi:hypothetical protein